MHGATSHSTNATTKLNGGFTRKTQTSTDWKNSAANTTRSSEEYTMLEMELETSTQKLAIAKKDLDEADSKLKRLEEKRQAIEELKRKEARLHSDAVNTGRTLASLTERIQGKKTILDNLRQRQVSIDTQAKLCLSKLEQAGLPINQPAQITAHLHGDV